jgi:hypothetical protein
MVVEHSDSGVEEDNVDFDGDSVDDDCPVKIKLSVGRDSGVSSGSRSTATFTIRELKERRKNQLARDWNSLMIRSQIE